MCKLSVNLENLKGVCIAAGVTFISWQFFFFKPHFINNYNNMMNSIYSNYVPNLKQFTVAVYNTYWNRLSCWKHGEKVYKNIIRFKGFIIS